MKLDKKPVNKKKKGLIIATIIGLILLAAASALIVEYDLARNYNLVFEELTTGSIETETGIYYGSALDLSKEEHPGRFEFTCGDQYDGDWNKKIISGTGTYIYDRVGAYEGEFVNGMRSGDGTFTWKDGSVYEGKWKDDKMNGEGVCIFSDGSKLEGTFEDNHIKTGKYVCENNENIYTYTITNSVLAGQIAIQFEDGTEYEGEYENGYISGEGTIVYFNGDIYKGELKKGKKAGKGTYYWEITGDVFHGTWKDDKMNGEGVFTTASDETLKGTFIKNKPSGTCIYEEDGEQYKTTWKNGVCIKVVGI